MTVPDIQHAVAQLWCVGNGFRRLKLSLFFLLGEGHSLEVESPSVHSSIPRQKSLSERAFSIEEHVLEKALVAILYCCCPTCSKPGALTSSVAKQPVQCHSSVARQLQNRIATGGKSLISLPMHSGCCTVYRPSPSGAMHPRVSGL